MRALSECGQCAPGRLRRQEVKPIKSLPGWGVQPVNVVNVTKVPGARVPRRRAVGGVAGRAVPRSSTRVRVFQDGPGVPCTPRTAGRRGRSRPGATGPYLGSGAERGPAPGPGRPPAGRRRRPDGCSPILRCAVLRPAPGSAAPGRPLRGGDGVRGERGEWDGAVRLLNAGSPCASRASPTPVVRRGHRRGCARRPATAPPATRCRRPRRRPEPPAARWRGSPRTGPPGTAGRPAAARGRAGRAPPSPTAAGPRGRRPTRPAPGRSPAGARWSGSGRTGGRCPSGTGPDARGRARCGRGAAGRGRSGPSPCRGPRAGHRTGPGQGREGAREPAPGRAMIGAGRKCGR